MNNPDLSNVPYNNLLQEIKQREAIEDEDVDGDGIVDSIEKITHDECVDLAAAYMNKRAPVVLAEFFSHNSELPDVIGFNGSTSTLIECKVSRSDFLSDKRKSFRINMNSGMGDYRYYCAPKGLIKPEELPPRWGLIDVLPSGKLRKSRDAWQMEKKNVDAELYLLFYYARRAYYAGVHKIIIEYRGVDG